MSAPTWWQESCALEGWLGLAQRGECSRRWNLLRGPRSGPRAQPGLPHLLSGSPVTLSHHLPCSWVQIQLLPRVTQSWGRPRPGEALWARKTVHLPASPPASSGTAVSICPSVREWQLPRRTAGGFPALTLTAPLSSAVHQQSSAGRSGWALAGPQSPPPMGDDERGGAPGEGLLLLGGGAGASRGMRGLRLCGGP